MKTLTITAAMTLCAEMWDWLAENPLAAKVDWPRYKEVNKKYGHILNWCFACAYAERTVRRIKAIKKPNGYIRDIRYFNMCDFCPMQKVWGISGRCDGYRSPYYKWRKSWGDEDEKTFAKQIADGARMVLEDHKKLHGKNR